jgi:hypothetical protein
VAGYPPVRLASFVLITLFMVDVYSKKSIKLEDSEKVVAWSREQDHTPAASEGHGDNVVEDDSRDALVACDDQKAEDEADEDPIMQVMLKSIQDPDLAPIYEGLPDLG